MHLLVRLFVFLNVLQFLVLGLPLQDLIPGGIFVRDEPPSTINSSPTAVSNDSSSLTNGSKPTSEQGKLAVGPGWGAVGLKGGGGGGGGGLGSFFRPGPLGLIPAFLTNPWAPFLGGGQSTTPAASPPPAAPEVTTPAIPSVFPNIPQVSPPPKPQEPEDPLDDCSIPDSIPNTFRILSTTSPGDDGGNSSISNSSNATTNTPKRNLLFRLLKRVEDSREIVLEDFNPIRRAFQLLAPSTFPELLPAFFASANDISLNRLPAGNRYDWITGFSGILVVPQGHGRNYNRGFSVNGTEFSVGQRVPWEIRWDYDLVKGIHLNVIIGRGQQSVKYAIRLLRRKSPDETGKGNQGKGGKGGKKGGKGGGGTQSSNGDSDNNGGRFGDQAWQEATFQSIRDGLNQVLNYRYRNPNPRADQLGDTVGRLRPVFSAAELAAMLDELSRRWRPIAEGPCETESPF